MVGRFIDTMKTFNKYKKFIFGSIVFAMAVLPVFSVQAVEEKIDVLDISVDYIGDKTVEIKWLTNIVTRGKLLYGENKDSLNSYIGVAGQPTRYHKVAIGNLKEKTVYYYQIIPDENARPYTFVYKFKTGDFKDSVAPAIEDLHVVYIAGTMAVVSWATDEDSTSKVEYDENATYKKSVGSTSKTKNHLVILKNLKVGTTYFLRVYSQDADKNQNAYIFKHFTTRENDLVDKEDLRISKLRPSGPDDTFISPLYIKTSFSTNHYAKGKAVLKAKKFKTQTINLDYGLDHVGVFQFLTSGSEYTLEISMTDVFGKKVSQSLVIDKYVISTVGATAQAPAQHIANEAITNNENVSVLGMEFSYYTPSQALYKTSTSPRIYSILNGQKHYITSEASFNEYGYRWSDVKKVDESKLNSIPLAKLVKTPDKATVYYLYERAGKTFKLAIPTASAFESYPSNSWNKIVKINQNDIDSYGTANLVAAFGSPQVYYIDKNIKHYVSEAVFINKGFNKQDIVGISDAHLGGYIMGDPL